MTSPIGPLALVVNPEAGGRKGSRRLDRLRRALDDQGLDHEVRATLAPGDGARAARQALEDGARLLVAVGGDGTVHEVVNGMLDGDGRAHVTGAVLGVVAAGSGCDFVRTFGLPSRPAPAAARLAGGGVRAVDVARIGFVDGGGRPASRFFVNIAEAGLGASTAARAVRMPRSLGQSRYLAAFWAVLPGYRPGSARIDADGAPVYDGRAVNVVAANCRYFGGGMHISPRSDPGDGALELLVFNGRKTDSFTMLPKVYRGRHIPHRSIMELRGGQFRVTAEPALAVEADGEVLGTTPVTIDVVPAALTLKV